MGGPLIYCRSKWCSSRDGSEPISTPKPYGNPIIASIYTQRKDGFWCSASLFYFPSKFDYSAIYSRQNKSCQWNFNCKVCQYQEKLRRQSRKDRYKYTHTTETFSYLLLFIFEIGPHPSRPLCGLQYWLSHLFLHFFFFQHKLTASFLSVSLEFDGENLFFFTLTKWTAKKNISIADWKL